MSVEHCRSDRTLLQNKGLRNYDKDDTHHYHKNKYRSLLSAMWCHAFLNNYTEIVMHRWQTALGVTISTEV